MQSEKICIIQRLKIFNIQEHSKLELNRDMLKNSKKI
jgi:hypothetical protein